MLQSPVVMSPGRVLLASASPRRRQLLALGGWEFDTASSNVDEILLPGEEPAAYVIRLAREKASACAAHAAPGTIVIGADTTVVIDGEILGKPADAGEATAMLRKLRGRTHQVYTGITVVDTASGNLLSDLCITDVPMRGYSDDEISGYVATGDPLDKAGAYAIQHPGFQPVAAMAGCYASVMGLPLCHLTRVLREFEIEPPTDVVSACQAFLQYDCPVHQSILSSRHVFTDESK
jgi:nucleoside triphosphate pyrophosphatase